MNQAAARVRWGHQMFWRTNEFGTEHEAQTFATELRDAYLDIPGMTIRIELWDGFRWVVAADDDEDPITLRSLIADTREARGGTQ